MSLAATSDYQAPYRDVESLADDRQRGAHALLKKSSHRPNYFASLGAAAAYLAILGAVVTIGFKANQTPIEEEQVVELAPLAVDEPPPEEDIPPPPEAMQLPEPPPPAALDPIAPIEEPKPVEKPKPKKIVEKKTPPQTPRHNAPADAAPRRATTSATSAPAVRAPAAPPGATPSAIANHFHACMQRAAANAYPESQAPRTAHISYHASFSASGSLTSYSISPSGNGAFDAVANRLGSRCGSVPAPGKPVSLSGALTFSP
jgi:periplasmic protein TonB